MNKNYYKKNRSKNKKGIRNIDRLHILTCVFGLVAALVIVRLFNLQVLQHQFYEALASGQHELYQKLFPDRGEVYAQDPYAEDGTYKVVTNRDFNLVYANPSKIENPEEAAEQIYAILNLNKEEVLERLSKEDDVYEPLKSKATDFEVEAVEELELAGIGFREESWRYYPEREAFSHVTGFLGYSGDQKKGQYGVEGYFEEELAGTQGELRTEQDAGGRFIAVGDSMVQEAEDGKDLMLTIDKNVQYYACEKLAESVEKHGAKKGSVIIVEPETGKIMALCNYPYFDPNDYSDVDDINVFVNSAVTDQYEPGSVFKTFALASAMDLGKIGPETTYTDTGSVEIGPYTIKNSDEKSHGTVDMNFVLAESLNTGSIFAAREAGNEGFYNYVKDFGFGETTGIELAGEMDGDLTGLAKLKDIYTATGSYGQGLTVTPMQLVMAYAAIANQGTLMKPYLVDKLVYPSGYIEENYPEEVRQVLEPQTARVMSAMLVNVIDSGHAARAGVDGYFIGGKTGTAQIPDEDGSGYHKHRHKDTFVGYGPISNPKFVMLCKIDEPQDVLWSASSVAPLFGDIAKFLVNYYHIPPDRG